MAFDLSKLPLADQSRIFANAKDEARQLSEVPSVMGRQGAAKRFAGEIFAPENGSFAAQAYDPKHPGKKDIENWMGGYMNGIFSPELDQEAA